MWVLSHLPCYCLFFKKWVSNLSIFQAHFSVYATPKNGRPWGMFTIDTKVPRELGPSYDEPGDILPVQSSKVSNHGGAWNTVLLARLRFKPDVLEPTSKWSNKILFLLFIITIIFFFLIICYNLSCVVSYTPWSCRDICPHWFCNLVLQFSYVQVYVCIPGLPLFLALLSRQPMAIMYAIMNPPWLCCRSIREVQTLGSTLLTLARGSQKKLFKVGWIF